MPRQKNSMFGLWLIAGLAVAATAGWLIYLNRSGADLPSLNDIVSLTGSNSWDNEQLVQHLVGQGVKLTAVQSANEKIKHPAVYLFPEGVDNPEDIAKYFDQIGPNEKLEQYRGIYVEKHPTAVLASTRASTLPGETFTWSAFVFQGDPEFISEVRRALP